MSNLITWALVLAVIQTESSGDQNAQSPVGAKGLMQLMDDTGEELFRELKLEGHYYYDPFDPFQNIQLGAYYLQKLVNKYDGDLELALTAYHSGMGRVDKLLKQCKGKILADIKDCLGDDGQDYAEKVMEKLWKNTKTISSMDLPK